MAPPARCSWSDRRGALLALRANIAAFRAGDRCEVLRINALTVPAGPRADIVFLDPPYGQDLLSRTLARLRSAGVSGREA